MESTQITPLRTEFNGRGEVKGFAFTQIQSCDKAYLYQVTDKNNNSHFEVFKYKVNRSPMLDVPQVSYPSSRAFGLWAWHHGGIESAYKKYRELCK
jgi:hypothetical protein